MTVLSFAFLTLVLASVTFECTKIIKQPADGQTINTPLAIGPRIVGGQDATNGSVPYIVSLQREDSHSCGGAIIDKDWIITASHCVKGHKPAAYKIRVGTTKLSEPGPDYFVDRIHMHCNYNNPSLHNDIALMHLTESIEFNDEIQPVKLPTQQLRSGATVRLSGWGHLSLEEGPPDHLQTISLKYLPSGECKKLLSDDPDVSAGHVCTWGQVDEGSCNGDSGGPVVSSDGYLIGLVNWGYPCALGYPDAHASIYYYRDWIRRITSSQIDCFYKKFMCKSKCSK